MVSLSEFDDIPKEKFRRYEIAVIQNMREGVWKPQDITLKLISKEANADMRRLPGPVVVGIVGSGYASYLHCKGYERVGKIDVRLKTICDVDEAKATKLASMLNSKSITVALEELPS
ncbi:MAG TPA: hypothetical protein PLF07_03690 [Acetomicrobium sp.]|nr:hypothetical protein [Acetomicrobium sp.]